MSYRCLTRFQHLKTRNHHCGQIQIFPFSTRFNAHGTAIHVQQQFFSYSRQLGLPLVSCFSAPHMRSSCFQLWPLWFVSFASSKVVHGWLTCGMLQLRAVIVGSVTKRQSRCEQVIVSASVELLPHQSHRYLIVWHLLIVVKFT